MAIDTKPNFSSNKFEQCLGDIMNLSGCTQIYGLFDIETGATLTICENAGVGKILSSNSTGVATWQDATAQGITAISGGSGMNFSPITTTGEIILGTPSPILSTSTDISSGVTHHHAFSASTFVSGSQGILVSGSTNQFYLDDTYIASAVLPNLHTVDNVTSNQSLGDLPSGQTLGMVYITNNGTAEASVNLGTTTTGNDITPFEPITVSADEDVSITVNMRLSITENKTIYINSDDWTNVDLDVQWAHISYDNVPLPTGGTSYTFIGSGATQVLEEGNQITIYSPTGGTGGGTPAGADGSMQYNNGGTFGGTNLCFDDSLNHFGLNTTASTTSMFTIKSDVAYDSPNTMMEITIPDGSGTPISSFKVSTDQAYDLNTTIHAYCLSGYLTGAASPLILNGSNSHCVYAAGIRLCNDRVWTSGTLKLESNPACSVRIYPKLNLCSLTAASGVEGDMIRFSGHSTCPDGLYYHNDTTWVKLDSPVASAGGSDGNIQYNNGGTLGGTCLNWDDSLNHMGWNISASTSAMLSIKKDVDYSSCQTIMEFFSCNTSETEDLSMYKVCIGGSDKGGTVFTTCMEGWCCGTPAHLHINTDSISTCDVTMGAISNVITINSLFKLNPKTSAPSSPQEGMVYYDSTLNKLRVYTGSAWETITSS